MTELDYWKECLSSSFDEHGVFVTEEQLTEIARDVEGGRDCYSMCFHTPENPYIQELKDTKKTLDRELSKVFCKECQGSGRITTCGPYHSSNSPCWKCNGHGSHL